MTLSLGTAPTVTTGQLVWATDGGALKTEPATAYKNAGYLATVGPSVHAQNFWMNGIGAWVTYLSGAIGSLNTGKLDKGGDTLTGTVTPVANDSSTATVGTSSSRFRAFLSTLNIYTSLVFQASTLLNFATTTRFLGDFIPQTNNATDVGSTSLNLRRLFTKRISAGADSLISEANIEPSVNGSQLLGNITAMWSTVCSYVLRVHPTNPLGVFNRMQCILASANIFANGSLNIGWQINVVGTPGVSSTGKSATGVYEVFFNFPLFTASEWPTVQVTCQSGGTASRSASYTIQTSQRITVRTFDSSGTAQDTAFSITIIGSADF